MICDIVGCGKEIEKGQMRHSDGLGNYHVLCEFNQIRQQLHLPPFEAYRKVKFISGFSNATITPTGSRREDARAIDKYRFSWEKVPVS